MEKHSFESKDAYWEFVRTVRNHRRFIFDGESGNFLAAVRAASKSRSLTVKSGKRLFRARVGSEFAPNEEGYDEEHPRPLREMVPDPKHIKSGGRANPTGIAYLYLANTPETALAEMRPWVGESVTIGVFEIQTDINIVVCRAGSDNSDDLTFIENPSAGQIDKKVWSDISKAFSRPVTREDQDTSYLPTQILAEAFMAEGFNGIAYQSGLERGTNVVLFGVNHAKPIGSQCSLYTLKRVRYEFGAVLPYALYETKEGGKRGIYEIQTESP